ncbi:MAG: hypothetical protein AB7U83_14985 [Vicinamibacterales bacterium]
MTWREAAAIIYEAMARTGPTRGVRPAKVAPEACVLTRGGDIVLEGEAARARAETILCLLEFLLPACDSHGGLGVAYQSGRAGQFLDELALQVTAKRRRVEIAGVAIRSLGLDAEARRVELERQRAEEEETEKRRKHVARPLPGTVAGSDWTPEDFDPDEPIELPPDLPRDLIPVDAAPWRPSGTLLGRQDPAPRATPLVPLDLESATHDFERRQPVALPSDRLLDRRQVSDARWGAPASPPSRRESTPRTIPAVGLDHESATHDFDPVVPAERPPDPTPDRSSALPRDLTPAEEPPGRHLATRLNGVDATSRVAPVERGDDDGATPDFDPATSDFHSAASPFDGVTPGDYAERPIDRLSDLPARPAPVADGQWQPRELAPDEAGMASRAARAIGPEIDDAPSAMPGGHRGDHGLWPRADSPPSAMTAALTVDDEFQQLRAATLRAAASAGRLDYWSEARRLLAATRVPVAAAALVAALASAAWLTWPAPAVRLPAAPPRVDIATFPPKPLPADWSAPVATPTSATSRSTAVAVPTAAVVPRLPPPAPAPPVAIEPSPAPMPAATSVPMAPAASAPSRVATFPEPERPGDDMIFSGESPGITPPVIRSPGVASTAMKAPGEAIDGPYFEVLVSTDGSVETVRIRGRIEPGETFYRHRMMLAAAKLWRFTPATLNGQPVRYVARVVLDEP